MGCGCEALEGVLSLQRVARGGGREQRGQGLVQRQQHGQRGEGGQLGGRGGGWGGARGWRVLRCRSLRTPLLPVRLALVASPCRRRLRCRMLRACSRVLWGHGQRRQVSSHPGHQLAPHLIHDCIPSCLCPAPCPAPRHISVRDALVVGRGTQLRDGGKGLEVAEQRQGGRGAAGGAAAGWVMVQAGCGCSRGWVGWGGRALGGVLGVGSPVQHPCAAQWRRGSAGLRHRVRLRVHTPRMCCHAACTRPRPRPRPPSAGAPLTQHVALHFAGPVAAAGRQRVRQLHSQLAILRRRAAHARRVQRGQQPPQRRVHVGARPARLTQRREAARACQHALRVRPGLARGEGGVGGGEGGAQALGQRLGSACGRQQRGAAGWGGARGAARGGTGTAEPQAG